jgi:hypothetical protein
MRTVRGLVIRVGLALPLMAVPGRAAIPVVGQVLDGERRPVAGAEVELRRVEPPETEALAELEGAPTPAVARATASPDGGFRIDAPSPGVYRVRITRPGFVPVESVALPVVEETELEPARLARDSGAELLVVAGDEAAPVPGARVRIEVEPRPTRSSRSGPEAWRPAAQLVRSGEDGRVRFAAESRPSWTAAIAADGLAPRRIERFIGDRHRVALERGSPRVVEVRRANRPVAGGAIVLFDGPLTLARTGPDGRALLAGPPRSDLEIGALRSALSPLPGSAREAG